MHILLWKAILLLYFLFHCRWWLILVAKHLGLCSQWQRSSSRTCDRLCDLYQNSTNRRRGRGSLWSSSPADVTLVQGFTVRDFSERDFPCEGMDLLVHTLRGDWTTGCVPILSQSSCSSCIPVMCAMPLYNPHRWLRIDRIFYFIFFTLLFLNH